MIQGIRDIRIPTPYRCLKGTLKDRGNPVVPRQSEDPALAAMPQSLRRHQARPLVGC